MPISLLINYNFKNMELPEWKGSKPQRFSGGRVHLNPDGQLNKNLLPKYQTLQNCGIRTFQRSNTQEASYRPHMKLIEKPNPTAGKEIDLRGKKYLQFSAQEGKKIAGKKYMPGGFETIDEVKLRGIKPFKNHNSASQIQYGVENKLQRKIRVDNIISQRNNVSVRALGDKAYKYPEYSANFYKQGGLIPGSTNKMRASSIMNQKIGPVLTKPNWDQKVKIQEQKEEANIVNSVDQWQQTTLKQANPSWNDPDTFFQRLQASKTQAKDIKKGKK